MEFSPYTPNIDSSILGKIQTPDILGGIQKGMALRDQMDKKKEEDKLKTDMTAATQGLDATTEQGMAQVAARLLQSGHQAEALQIHKMAMDLHEKSAKTYQSVDFGDRGMGSFDTSTNKYTYPQAQPPASPYGDTQSMGNQAPPMISNAPMPQASPMQGMGMPQMSQPPQPAPQPAPVPQAAPITSAAYQKSKAEFDLKKAARDADAAFKADIPNYEGQIKAIGSDMTKRDLIASQIMAKHGGSTLAKDYVTSVLKPNAQPSYMAVMNAPVADKTLDSAAQRIANKQSTLSEEISKGRWVGPKAMEMHDNLVQKVQALDPNYSEQDSEAGAAYAKTPRVRTAIQQLDNAYSTIGRLKDVYSNLDNNQFPTLNKVFNSGKIKMGDVNAARAAIAEIVGSDEITGAFAKGGTGSNQLRDMSNKLTDYNGSPQQQAAQFDEIMHGLARSRAAYETQGAGYIRPMKGQKTDTPTLKPHPADDAMVKWAKENPNATGAAEVLKANGL